MALNFSKSSTSVIKTGTRCFKLLDRKSRIQLSFLALAILAGTGLETISLSLVLPLLQYVINPDTKATSGPFNALIDMLPVISGGPGVAISIVSLMAILFAIKNLILLGVAYAQFMIVFNNEKNFSCKLFDSYLARPFSEMLGRNSADMIRNVREVVSTAFKGVIMGFISTAIEALMIVTILGILIVVQPYSALVACAFLVPGTVLYQQLTKAVLYKLGHGEMDATRSMLKAIQEGLHSLKATKVFGREGYFGNSFRTAKEKSARIAIVTNTIHQTPRLWFETIIIATAACIVVIMLLTTPAETVAPALGLFAVAMLRLMPSFNRLSQALNTIQNGAAALETLETEYAYANSHMADNSDNEDSAKLKAFESLLFDHVTFTYPSKDEASILDISLEIKAGQIIALVGSSGAGKTTVADLLLGLLQPTDGNILINSVPLSQIARQWRNIVAYVPQQVYLSDNTLRRNIAFALPDNLIDDHRIIQAMRDAQIDDLLETLPDGLDTSLGEHGRMLSVGQQQRVGIARALYDQPSLLVLDEATSALDLKTESEISTVINALGSKITVVIIAHRLSTVKHADRIILMRNGRVAGADTFSNLLAGNDEFAHLVDLAKL